MKKWVLIALVLLIALVIASFAVLNILSQKADEAYLERGRAEGVPEVCLQNKWDSGKCDSYCRENPVDCGRPAS